MPFSVERPSRRNARELQHPLVWIDLEMTGLDLERDTIIEYAVIVSDGELQHLIEGPATAIHHSDAVLEGMNDWCKEHHGTPPSSPTPSRSQLGRCGCRAAPLLL